MMDNGNLAMHATLMKATASAKAQGGKSYKLTFAYPRGYLAYVDEVIDMRVDVYWNEEILAHSAHVKSANTKPIKNADPMYLVHLECDAMDTGLANANDLVDSVGDVRFAVTQLAAFKNP